MRLTILVLALLVLGASGCKTNPATGRRQLLMLSTEETIALGKESMPALVAEYGGEVPSPDLESYVEQVGGSMAARTEAGYPSLPWEFTVLDSGVVNAFALPGGKVFASRGLLARLDNEAQLAGVLGHEIGHVTGRHVNERISQALIVTGITIGAVAAAGQSDSDWAAVVPIVVGVGGQGYLLSFGRNQEKEADEQGVKYMTAAGYDPHGMLEVLEVLDAAGGGPRGPEFLATHPHPKTRIETVSALLAGPYRYTQGNAQYQKYPDRYRQEALPHIAGALPGPQLVAWCGLCRAAAAPP